jgi:hypothetical protein
VAIFQQGDPGVEVKVVPGETTTVVHSTLRSMARNGATIAEVQGSVSLAGTSDGH